MGLMVIDSGFWTTVQDAGRVGYREWGVPVGGAFDRGSADLANALVGNGPESAVLELTLRGGSLRGAREPGVGLAGAPIEATLVGLDGPPAPLRVPSSCLAAAPAIAWCWVGRAKGRGPTWPSRTASGPCLGWAADRPSSPSGEGTSCPRGRARIPTRHPGEPGWTAPDARPIRIIAGPDASRLARPRSAGHRARFRVGSRSNRMGLRLEGPPLRVASVPDRLSAPVCPGAIQVAGGQLIILGVAGGTMGGYPHVAHVISADLDRLGQLLPGDRIRFRPVTLAEARELDRAARQAHRAMLVRIASLARDL